MVLDNGYPYPGQALPTPTDTPYQTPSRGLSGRSSRQTSSSAVPNYSSSPFPPSDDSYFSNQHTTIDAGDERYSARDPRRLTQNLDMSLVSQIHSLKKELESKDNLIHTLEDSLHQSKAENERLTADLTTQKAEVKSVKSQMQSLEYDMLKEFEKTVRERDDAVESVADTRKRLEDSKKKVRAQEEDANRTNELWERDRQDLEDKNRRLESKNNVLEQHLKTMAAAMAAQSTAQSQIFVTDDNFGARTSSRQSNRSLDDIYEDKPAINFRDSRVTSLRRPGSSQMGSLSLAEELELGDEEDENEDEDDSATKFSYALPEEEQPSRRYSEDEKAKKVMGFHADGSEPRARDRSSSQTSMKSVDSHLRFLRKQSAVAYTDTAIQCSPLPSPTPQSRQVEFASEKTIEQTEHAANQSRKRVSIPQIFVEQNPTVRSEVSKPKATKALRMVSTACQTVEEPSSPLSSPKSTNGLPIFVPAKETRTWSTQTSDDGLPAFTSAGPRISLSPLDVPVIAIHPPSSRPPSSHNSVVLPPRTKNAGCQVAIEMPTNLRSTAMQTDQVQIEKRPIRLPLRLQLSSPSSQPPSQFAERRVQAPEAPHTSAVEPSKHAVPIVPPKSSRRSIPSPSTEVEEGWRKASSPQIEDAYPGNNDNGPLNSKDRFSPRRPIRSDSIFAGFDASDDGNDKVPSDYSDDDFGNAAPIRKTLSKVQNSWKLVPLSDDSVFDRVRSASEDHGDQTSKELSKMPIPKAKGFSQSSSKTFTMKHTEPPRKSQSTTKEADTRRKAPVTNGIAGHTQRARSPSLPNAPGKETTVAAPPFPVPTRSSSRRIPVSASDGAVSPSPYTTSFFTTRRGQDPGKVPNKRKMLRKTQSAAAVSKTTGPLPPHPPLPKSASSSMPGRPKSPRLPHNQFVLPYDHVAELPSQLSKASRPPSHAGQASIEAPSQQTSVVDAIAQTMVGEWMWKYVRKRTSFGITETPQAEFEMGRNGETGNSSGVRHKRWVWLAPYENAVIWSSKQPTSGPALLGKGGRKLTIQSVLDVKDDTPLPKNAGTQSAFDRSILILTPERALKFTATSRDRHYIWLTALSFLSHSTHGMVELTSPPPMPQQEYQPPVSQVPVSGSRRTTIRDSIRVAKDKPRPSFGTHSYSSPPSETAHETISGTTNDWGDTGRLSEDAAEPPQIPRIAAHARKRSSTGPRPVPLSAFHSYPGNSISLGSSFSSQAPTHLAPTSRDKYDRYIPRSRGGLGAERSRDMAPYIESYTPPPIVPDNFYDPAGTMRMEAFVDRNESRNGEPLKAKREAKGYRTRQGKKKDLSYWGVEDGGGSSGAPSLRLRGEDPFSGF